MTEGRTFSFATDWLPDYGIQAFLPDRQVVWQSEGHCDIGHCYAQNGLICFELVSPNPGPYCWAYHEAGPVLIGVRGGEAGGDRLLMKPSRATAICNGVPVG